jgi:hypothetical protein
MWEYERKNYKFRVFPDLLIFLNEMGKDGWEIIYYKEDIPDKYDYGETTAKVLFKRKKE